MPSHPTLDKPLCEPDKAGEGTQQPLNTEAGCIRQLRVPVNCIYTLKSSALNPEKEYNVAVTLQFPFFISLMYLALSLLSHHISCICNGLSSKAWMDVINVKRGESKTTEKMKLADGSDVNVLGRGLVFFIL